MRGTSKQVSKRLFESANEIFTWPMFRDHEFTIVREEKSTEIKFSIHVKGSFYPIFEISTYGIDEWARPALMIRQQSHNAESLVDFGKQLEIVTSCFLGVVARWERAQEEK